MGLSDRDTIKFSQSKGEYVEHISLALVREAIRTLPDDSALRTKLQKLSTDTIPMSKSDLMTLEEMLVEFAHSNPSELGLVGRIPEGSTGRIVEQEKSETRVISSLTVLALAIRRFTTLYGLGTRVVVVKDTEE